MEMMMIGQMTTNVIIDMRLCTNIVVYRYHNGVKVQDTLKYQVGRNGNKETLHCNFISPTSSFTHFHLKFIHTISFFCAPSSECFTHPDEVHTCQLIERVRHDQLH